MSVSAVHVIASVLAFLAQVVGALLVLRESARLRRSELNRLGLIGRFRAEVKLTVQNPAPPNLERVHAGGVSSTSAVVTTPVPETQAEGLQRRVSELEAVLLGVREGLSSEMQTLRGRTEALETGLDKQVSELREKRRSDIQRAIKLQGVGAVVFLVGVALGLAANLVS